MAAVKKSISSFALNVVGCPLLFTCFPLNLLYRVPYDILYFLLAANIEKSPSAILVNASFNATSS
jgi:hypothetical protein